MATPEYETALSEARVAGARDVLRGLTEKFEGGRQTWLDRATENPGPLKAAAMARADQMQRVLGEIENIFAELPSAATPSPSEPDACPHCNGTRRDTITASNGGVGEVVPCWACAATVAGPPRRTGNYEQASRLVESYALGVETDLQSVMDRVVSWLSPPPSEPGEAEGLRDRVNELEAAVMIARSAIAYQRDGEAEEVLHRVTTARSDWADEDGNEGSRFTPTIDLDLDIAQAVHPHRHVGPFDPPCACPRCSTPAPPSPASEPEGDEEAEHVHHWVTAGNESLDWGEACCVPGCEARRNGPVEVPASEIREGDEISNGYGCCRVFSVHEQAGRPGRLVIHFRPRDGGARAHRWGPDEMVRRYEPPSTSEDGEGDHDCGEVGPDGLACRGCVPGESSGKDGE